MNPERTIEPMTRPELRVFLQTWFCGCGNPEEGAEALLRLLRLHPAYEHHEAIAEMLPDMGVRMLMLYTLDRFELTEHGGNVGGAWLTDKGIAVRDALAAEEADFEPLFESACIHGYDISDQDHDCMAEERDDA